MGNVIATVQDAMRSVSDTTSLQRGFPLHIQRGLEVLQQAMHSEVHKRADVPGRQQLHVGQGRESVRQCLPADEGVEPAREDCPGRANVMREPGDVRMDAIRCVPADVCKPSGNHS